MPKLNKRPCKHCGETFQKKTPLQMFCGAICASKYKYAYEVNKQRKVIKKESAKRITQREVYRVVKKAYVLKNPYCEVCGIPANEIHHKAGKIGHNYTDDRTFMNICRPHHTWIHENPKQSRLKGWML